MFCTNDCSVIQATGNTDAPFCRFKNQLEMFDLRFSIRLVELSRFNI